MIPFTLLNVTLVVLGLAAWMVGLTFTIIGLAVVVEKAAGRS